MIYKLAVPAALLLILFSACSVKVAPPHSTLNGATLNGATLNGENVTDQLQQETSVDLCKDLDLSGNWLFHQGQIKIRKDGKGGYQEVEKREDGVSTSYLLSVDQCIVTRIELKEKVVKKYKILNPTSIAQDGQIKLAACLDATCTQINFNDSLSLVPGPIQVEQVPSGPAVNPQEVKVTASNVSCSNVVWPGKWEEQFVAGVESMCGGTPSNILEIGTPDSNGSYPVVQKTHSPGIMLAEDEIKSKLSMDAKRCILQLTVIEHRKIRGSEDKTDKTIQAPQYAKILGYSALNGTRQLTIAVCTDATCSKLRNNEPQNFQSK